MEPPTIPPNQQQNGENFGLIPNLVFFKIKTHKNPNCHLHSPTLMLLIKEKEEILYASLD